VDRIEPGFPMFRTEESVEEDEPGWCPALRRCAGSVRGHVSVRTAAPSGQADWHRASQVSRARSAASQAVTLRRHGDEVSAAGTENRTNRSQTTDGTPVDGGGVGPRVGGAHVRTTGMAPQRVSTNK
jgi:hypothetical protein